LRLDCEQVWPAFR